MVRRIGPLIWQSDVSPADWLVRSLWPWTSERPARVGSFVPAGFEAYGRLFHPACRRPSAEVEGVPVRWADVARANGRHAHPGMEWISITGSWAYEQAETQPGLWDQWPRRGSLPIPEAKRLARRLAGRTSTPELCWFAVWEGFGALSVPRDDSVAKVQLPHRAMLLFSGPVSGVVTSMEEPPWDQRASLWWPEDRAWCVATDVDLMSTLIGGGRSCITELVDDPELEVLAVELDQLVTYDADRVNPPPPRPST